MTAIDGIRSRYADYYDELGPDTMLDDIGTLILEIDRLTRVERDVSSKCGSCAKFLDCNQTPPGGTGCFAFVEAPF